MQRRQRFVPDQRFDLPQYDSMLSYIDAEFANYNSSFFSPENRIVQNWKLLNNGGLQVKVDQSVDSTLFNSEREGHQQFLVYKTTDESLTLDLVDNAINFVEVQITSITCASDIVAIWDPTANSGEGQEFTQTVDTANEEKPVLVSNTSSFTGDPDKLPLATVVTSGGAIVSITSAHNFLFHLDSDWNFGTSRTDKTIANFKNAFDALATSIKELKGLTNWYDKPYAGSKLLKEYQNMFVTGGGIIRWEGAEPANTLGWTSDLQIEIAGRSDPYIVDAGNVVIPEGSCAYLVIPEGAPSGSLSFVVADITAVPLNPLSVGYDPKIQILFFRRGGKIYGFMDIPEIESGGEVIIGEDLLSEYVKDRLGIISQTSYEAYANNYNYFLTDSYAAAISKLDAALNVIQTSQPLEETVEQTNPTPQTDFTFTISMDADIEVKDAEVWWNGQKMIQNITGNAIDGGHWYKLSTTSIRFFVAKPQNAHITLRRDRQGGGGGGGGSTDLTNITVTPQPSSNGSQPLGSVTKAWQYLYLKDTSSSQVYRMEIVGGVIQATLVP